MGTKKEYKVPKLKDFDFSKPRDEGDFLAPYTNRPISKYFSWFFVHFSLCAEFVALLTPVVDLVTIYFISQGYWIVAAILIELSLILDSADGEIARFRAKVKKRTKQQDEFGGYMDSMAGVLVFPLVIFSAGFYLGNFYLGLLGMLSFLLLNLSTANAGSYFSKKGSTSKKIQSSGFIGKIRKKFKIRGVIGFTGDIQKHVIALALLFQATLFLWVYFLAAVFLIFAKFWIYRK